VHLGVREIQAVCTKAVRKKEWKRKKRYFSTIFHWQKDRQTLQNTDGKQYCQYWIRCLIVFNWISRKQRLLVEALYQWPQNFFLFDGQIAITQQSEGRASYVMWIVSGFVTFFQIKKFFVNIWFFITDKHFSRAGWNGATGRIWLADRSLETPDLGQSLNQSWHNKR